MVSSFDENEERRKSKKKKAVSFEQAISLTAPAFAQVSLHFLLFSSI
jgi:hypothetical protein